jgi:hypothetical protein
MRYANGGEQCRSEHTRRRHGKTGAARSYLSPIAGLFVASMVEVIEHEHAQDNLDGCGWHAKLKAHRKCG